jgi:hypothetical protein
MLQRMAMHPGMLKWWRDKRDDVERQIRSHSSGDQKELQRLKRMLRKLNKMIIEAERQDAQGS